MSEFFQHYPQINYDITGSKPVKTKTAINIMVKAKIKSILKNDIVNYFPYSIPESERPDITSFKIYGDVKFTWLIFLINEIHDPLFDWPLNSREFGNYVKNKYGTLSAAKNTVHHYEEIVRTRIEATGTSDPIPEATIEVDLTTYNTLDGLVRKIVYCYDWEVDRNEAKRDIKLIDRRYVADMLSEHSEKLE
ncbi:uncharacterized protein METZ01_LOCUS324556 [marine metagenome]|uniref:Uncharacterized protein n=1 Tax=marine metagenome TaxID=408172 RepID=A0A382PIC5_9ZZZZ|tara:strand:- start:248 stop:823 length:576 start_codon:yes stop_codon:yes gene_type:complete